MEKVALIHRTRDRERNPNLKKTIPSHIKISVMGI
jgi:hypothetical protein